MTTIHISLPDSLRLFVAEQIAKGRYCSESEYLEVLIREAQRREAQQELEAKLLEGIRSPTSPMTPTDWAELRQHVLDRGPQRDCQ